MDRYDGPSDSQINSAMRKKIGEQATEIDTLRARIDELEAWKKNGIMIQKELVLLNNGHMERIATLEAALDAATVTAAEDRSAALDQADLEARIAELGEIVKVRDLALAAANRSVAMSGTRNFKLSVALAAKLNHLDDANSRIAELEREKGVLAPIAMAWDWLAIEGRSVARWGQDDWRIEVSANSGVFHDVGFADPYAAVRDAIERQMNPTT